MVDGSIVEEPYPFPFFGAGDAGYFEWAEVHVRFSWPPNKAERKAIKARVPGPLTDSIDWDGAQLLVASDQFVQLWIADGYDEDFHIGDAFEGDDDPREFEASATQVAAFNADIESWLRFAHEQCPILVAYRMEDGEAGGTELSDWHTWSLGQLPGLATTIAPALAQAKRRGGPTYMMRGIISMARDADVAVPESLLDWRRPARHAVAALLADDPTLFAELLGERPSAAMMKDLAKFIEKQNTAGWEPGPLTAVLTGALRCLGQPKPPGRFVEAVAVATAAASEITSDGVSDVLGQVLDLLRVRLGEKSIVVDRLGLRAYRLVQQGKFTTALGVFDLIVDGPEADLTLYNNALYAIQADNNHLPVQPERARHYLAAALPYGPRNPAIFYNAACAWYELGDIEETLRCLESAVAAGYDDLPKMRDEPLFGPIAGDPRFQQIFAPSHFG